MRPAAGAPIAMSEQSFRANVFMASRRASAAQVRSNIMRAAMLGTILLVVLILLLVGAIPSWPHSRNWGYGPSGGVGLILVILIILMLLGRLPF